jgi:hypothetical protein
MANLKIKDGDSSNKFVKASGTGTDNDPYITENRTIISALPSLASGTNLIGKVDIETLPSVTLANNTSVNISGSVPPGNNNIGKVVIDNPILISPTANIGVNSLPSLPTGTNNIGKIDVNTLPNIRSSRQRLREDFSGSELRSEAWDWDLGVGQSFAVSSSLFQINIGTSANSSSVFSTTYFFKIPCRVSIIFRTSQRINNQEVYFEICDSNNENKAGFLLDGTITTVINHFAFSEGSSIGNSAININSSASFGIIEFDVRATEINFSSRATESNSARTGVATRNRQIPNPNLDYKFQIRVKNLATAPASNTTLSIDSVVIEDIEEINAEISTSRAATHLGNAAGVHVLGGSSSVSVTNTVSVSGSSVSVSSGSISATDSLSTITETAAPLTANAIFNSPSRDTNLIRNTLRLLVATDQAGTLVVEQSPDTTNWHLVQSIPCASGVTTHEQKLFLRYYRIRYTNGATAQGSLRIYSTTASLGA